MPLGLEQHKWLRRLTSAVALYLLLLPVWWFSLGAIAMLHGVCANLLYHNLIDSQVSIQADGRNINFFVTANGASGFGGQQHASALRMDTATYGLPMLVALVLVTGAQSWHAKLRALGIGIVVMNFLALVALLIWAKKTSLEMDAAIASATLQRSGSSAGLWVAFHGYAFSQPAFAVIIWFALMMLGFFKDRAKAEKKPHQKAKEKSASVTRNSPCPCGSGRKYKRCCGRA